MRSSLRIAGALALASLSYAPAASAQNCLTTLFARNNGLSANSCCYFDATASAALLINALEMNYTGSAGVACGLELWVTPGTYVGNEANPAAWTQVATDNGTAVTAGQDVPTPVTLNNPYLMNPGSYGLCVIFLGAGSSYTNGNGSNGFYSDPFLSLTLGASDSVPFTTSPIANRIWNGSVCYNPASGIYANFSANTTSGPSPLTVNFSDTTYSSPNPVVAWAWDLDGNGTIDSNAQNPSFTYNNCGPYTVTLTATDSTNASSTITKTDFIFADPQLVVTADFAASSTIVAAGSTVNFTDASAGNPATWSWDLDGDNNPDSTAQNPSFTYNTPGFFTVSLTAGNACFGDTRTKTNFIQVLGATSNTQSADMFEYQFNEVRGMEAHNTASTNLFPPTGAINIAGWQKDTGRPDFRGNEAGFGCLGQRPSGGPWVNTGSPLRLNGSFTLMWWMRRDPSSTAASPFGYSFSDGSVRSFQGSAGIFIGGATGSPLSSTVNAGHLGFLTPSVWNHYAWIVDDTAGTAILYENGNPGVVTNFTPGTMVYNGSANNLSLGGTPTGGSLNTAHFDYDDFRLYSSALTPAQLAAEAAAENPTTYDYDSGCTDSGGFSPAILINGAPQIGNAGLAMTFANMEPGRPAALYVGVNTHLGGILPLDLSGSGLFGAGCNLSVTPDAIINFGTGSGTVVVPTPIPIDPTLAGSHTYSQLITVGSGALSAVSAPQDANVQF